MGAASKSQRIKTRKGILEVLSYMPRIEQAQTIEGSFVEDSFKIGNISKPPLYFVRNGSITTQFDSSEQEFKCSCDIEPEGVCYHMFGLALLLLEEAMLFDDHKLVNNSNFTQTFRTSDIDLEGIERYGHQSYTKGIHSIECYDGISLFIPLKSARVTIVMLENGDLKYNFNSEKKDKESIWFLVRIAAYYLINENPFFFSYTVSNIELRKKLVFDKYKVRVKEDERTAELGFQFRLTNSGLKVELDPERLKELNPILKNQGLIDSIKTSKSKLRVPVDNLSIGFLLDCTTEGSNSGIATGQIKPCLLSETGEYQKLIDNYWYESINPYAFKTFEYYNNSIDADSIKQDLLDSNESKRETLKTFKTIRNSQRVNAILKEGKGKLFLIQDKERITKGNIETINLSDEKITFATLYSVNEENSYVITLEAIVNNLSYSEFLIVNHVTILLDKKLFFIDDINSLKLLSIFSEERQLIVKNFPPFQNPENLIETFALACPITTSPEFPIQVEDDVRINSAIEFVGSGKDIHISNSFVFSDGLIVPLNEQRIYKHPTQARMFIDFNQLGREGLEFVKESLGSKQFQQSTFNKITLSREEALSDLWLGRFIMKAKANGFMLIGEETIKGIKFSSSQPELKEQLFEEIDWFSVKVDVYFGKNKVEIDELILAISKGEETVLLKDGSLGIITEELENRVKSLRDRTEFVKKGKFFKAPKSNLKLIEQLAFESNNQEILKNVRERTAKIENFKLQKLHPIPKSIKGEPRDYQKDGFNYLQVMEGLGLGAVLADQMGLGKTYQALMISSYLKDKFKKKCKPILILCPVTLLDNWIDEVNKFAPDISYYMYYGKGRKKEIDLAKCEIVLTSYSTYRLYPDAILNISWQALFLDEAQNIKNPAAQITSAVNKIKTAWTCAITGTPMENSPQDIYSIFDFVNKGFFGSKAGFNEFYTNPIKKGDVEKARSLHNSILPFYIRRLKANVLSELPPKTELIIHCTLNEGERNLYEATRQTIQKRIQELKESGESSGIGMVMLSGILKLRQICNHPLLLKEVRNSNQTKEYKSSKMQLLIEQLLEITQDHKVIVFTTYIESLMLIQSELKNNGIESITYTGKLNIKKRKERINRFKNGGITEENTSKVLIMTIKSGGVGLNLTEADYVFIYEPWWNPAVESQAIDRVHRIGQMRNVTAYRYICRDTVEEKIQLLKNKKGKMFQDIVEGDIPELSKQLTLKDMEFILAK
jgi:SNF2 family DNA or RNA helicase